MRGNYCSEVWIIISGSCIIYCRQHRSFWVRKSTTVDITLLARMLHRHSDRIWLHYVLDSLALSVGRVFGTFHRNSKGIFETGKWAEYGRDSLFITILKRKHAKISIGKKMHDVDCFEQSSWVGEIDSGKQWDQQNRTEMWTSGLCAVNSERKKSKKEDKCGLWYFEKN